MNTQQPIRSSLRDFLHVIFKRKYQMALFFIITVSIVAAITYSMTPTYRATAQILVKIGSRNVYTLPGSPAESMNSFNRVSKINTEKEFLKSRFLAEKVLEYFGSENITPETESDVRDSSWFEQVLPQLQTIKSIKNKIFPRSDSENADHARTDASIFEQQILSLQKNLSVENIANTDILQISFTWGNAEKAARILNTYMDIYLDERLRLQRNAQSRTFFEDQSSALKQRLEEAEEKLEQFKNENNITNLEQQQRLLLQQISDVRVSLNKTISTEIETKSRISLLTDQLSKTPETIPQGEVTDHNELLMSRLQATLVELQIEEKELLSKYTPQSRLVKNVRERISIVESKIQEQENKLIQTRSVGVNATYQRLKEELLRNEAEIEALRVKKDTLNSQLAEFQSEKEKFNRMETRLNGLQQSVDLYRTNYKLYLAKLEAARIEDAMDSQKINDVTIMNRALPPLNPVSPKYRLNMLLGILIGGMGALLWAIVSDHLDDSLETPEDVEKTLQLPVLTSIPNASGRRRLDHRRVDTVLSPHSIQMS